MCELGYCLEIENIYEARTICVWVSYGKQDACRSIA